MARRTTAPGDTTALAYHVRTDRGPWAAAAPTDAALARARRGRQWRARTRMGRTDGTTMTLSRTGATPTEARVALERVIAHTRREMLDPTPVVPTLGDLLAWVVERIESGRDDGVGSPRSVRRYIDVARRWGGHPAPDDGRDRTVHASRVHGIRIVDLTPADLADEVERIAGEGGTSALPQLRALWRKATARALALRLITTDPAAGLRLPSARATRGTRVYSNGAPRARDNALTPEQTVELRAAVRVRHPRQRLDVADLIVLGTYTGLRLGEAVGLRWVDVHLSDGGSHLTIAGQIYGEGADRQWEPRLKTTSSFRTVPLARPAADLLRRRQADALAAQVEGDGHSGAAFVFPSHQGGVPDQATASKAIRRTLDRAGFPWATFHTLRRTVEGRLTDAGTDPRVIMSVMGHDPATSWAAYTDRGVDVSGAADVLG